MQIYRGMDIGTAKPDEAERAGIPHWLLDVADPTDPRGYSCADYVRDARAAVADILARGKLPILCGGTGLYLDAFLRGGTFEVTDTDPHCGHRWRRMRRRTVRRHCTGSWKRSIRRAQPRFIPTTSSA